VTYDPHQPPSGQYPLPYASQYTLPVNPRPGAMTGLAVTSLILAIFLVSCMSIMLVTMSGNAAAMDFLRQDELLWQWAIIGSGARCVAGVVLLIASIGLLSLKPWARVLLNAYALTIIGIQIIDVVISTHVFDKLGIELPEASKLGQYGGYLIWIAHGVWVLIYINGANAKAALAGRPASPAWPPPGAAYPPAFQTPRYPTPGLGTGPSAGGYPPAPPPPDDR
jgi:hypothetical protein